LPNDTKVWKIHGSLGWHYELETGRILRVNPDENDILIYPSSLKYQESKKQPYESLMDRLSNFLRQDDSILFTCGYSWGDEHINSRIISALKTNTTSHVIGLIFDKYKKEDDSTGYQLGENNNLSKIGLNNTKISLYGQRHAIIGCKQSQWKLKTEPDPSDTVQLNLYFDEDAPLSKSNEIGKEKKDDLVWTGQGEFKLTDFAQLVEFLKSMISENEIGELSKYVKK
jgi:hypothetical protein